MNLFHEENFMSHYKNMYIQTKPQLQSIIYINLSYVNSCLR